MLRERYRVVLADPPWKFQPWLAVRWSVSAAARQTQIPPLPAPVNQFSHLQAHPEESHPRTCACSTGM